MRALVLGGKTGLLGQALTQALRDGGHHVLPHGRETFDPFHEKGLQWIIDTGWVDVVFNTVAYTAVDKAEREPEEAMRLNADLPEIVAKVCADNNALLVHYSTDFVFNDGDRPFREGDPVDPQSVYGSTKLEGEKRVVDSDCDHLIIRTSWLFGPGKMNFVDKMVGMGHERDELSVVDDQRGSPTFTPDLAKNSVALVESGGRGLFHLTQTGDASWYELAAEAIKAAELDCDVLPVTSDQFPQQATRPRYSALDTGKFTELTGITPRSWIECVREYAGK